MFQEMAFYTGDFNIFSSEEVRKDSWVKKGTDGYLDRVQKDVSREIVFWMVCQAMTGFKRHCPSIIEMIAVCYRPANSPIVLNYY